MDREYIAKQYKQAVLEFKAAVNEDAQWTARETMASLERTALELFGEDFVNDMRESNGLDTY